MSIHLSRLGTAAVFTATLLTIRPTVGQSAPPLEIQRSEIDQVELFWPASTNFNVLQEAFGLAATNSWLDVPDAPDVLGTRYSVRRDATNSVAFRAHHGSHQHFLGGDCAGHLWL